jgi:superfamily I DNA/RNA helicase
MIAILKQQGVPFWNPYRTSHGGWNPLRGAQRLLAFLRPDPDVWQDQARFWTWTDVKKWGEKMKAKDIWERGSKDFLASKAQDVEKLQNSAIHADYEEPEISIADLAQHLTTEEVLDRVYERDVNWWHENLLKDAHKSARYPVTVYEKHGGLALRRDPKIIVGTIHSVKGGEADSVYVFPDLSRRGWIANWQNPATRASSFRLFYVAFTRAREKLTLCEPASGEAVVFPTPEVSGK